MIIYLFSGSGDSSTALMYSFNQRPDTYVMDDPFYGIWLKKTGEKQAYYDEIMLRMECDDANKIHDEIEKNEKIQGNVFVKNNIDTAQYMNENRLLKYRHIFVIDDPAETIVSRIITDRSKTSADIYLEQQLRTYNWLKEKTKEDPIVIDSNGLNRDPTIALTHICEKLNLPFTDKMLSWPAGPKSIDGLWAESSYNEVHASTGFRTISSTKRTRDTIPNHLVSLYDAALPYYEKLLTHSI
ncbi:unnamed protein product [Adineta steineri]|uniref:Uncharacterized protein n=1 Tax=Adineta steineri TaxID=433720 RepID=A0A818T7F7_9BILA|nr:unnamed protein product [Adineta steineri]